jgi:hypothetical protein
VFRIEVQNQYKHKTEPSHPSRVTVYNELGRTVVQRSPDQLEQIHNAYLTRDMALNSSQVYCVIHHSWNRVSVLRIEPAGQLTEIACLVGEDRPLQVGVETLPSGVSIVVPEHSFSTGYVGMPSGYTGNFKAVTSGGRKRYVAAN